MNVWINDRSCDTLELISVMLKHFFNKMQKRQRHHGQLFMLWEINEIFFVCLHLHQNIEISVNVYDFVTQHDIFFFNLMVQVGFQCNKFKN